MLITLVPLPRDGAKFHCTFTRDGVRCNTETRRGLSMSDYDLLRESAPYNVTFMRALCKEHSFEVSTYA